MALHILQEVDLQEGFLTGEEHKSLSRALSDVSRPSISIVGLRRLHGIDAARYSHEERTDLHAGTTHVVFGLLDQNAMLQELRDECSIHLLHRVSQAISKVKARSRNSAVRYLCVIERITGAHKVPIRRALRCLLQFAHAPCEILLAEDCRCLRDTITHWIDATPVRLGTM